MPFFRPEDPRSAERFPIAVDDLDSTLTKLAQNPFRRKFKLFDRERAYLERWGIEKVMRDALELLTARVAPAEPKNDGKQTPWRNHPVFIAQHATATCCRGCIEKWHAVPKGRPLSQPELEHLLSVIRRWLETA